MISSSFFGVLIPGQSFWKDAKIVNRRFSGMDVPKETNFAFRGFNFESQRAFSPLQLFF